MEHPEAKLRVLLHIRPVKGTVLCPVSLRASWSSGGVVRSMTSPQQSWHAITRRMEEMHLMDDEVLGYLDAHIGTGEPVSCSLTSSVRELHRLGLCEAEVKHATQRTAFSEMKPARLVNLLRRVRIVRALKVDTSYEVSRKLSSLPALHS